MKDVALAIAMMVIFGLILEAGFGAVSSIIEAWRKK